MGILGYLFISLCIIVTIVFIIGARLFWKKLKHLRIGFDDVLIASRQHSIEFVEKTLNFNWIFVLIIGIFVSGIIYLALILSHSIELHIEKVVRINWLEIIVFFLGVIGALWAVVARIDAGKAFNESERTRLSFGSSFSFSDILTDVKMPNIIRSIGKRNTTVALFLGFPCVACFYKEKMSFDKGVKDIGKVFGDLLDQLKDVANQNGVPDYSLYLGVFPEERLRELWKDKNNPLRDDPRNYLNEYLEIINKLRERQQELLNMAKTDDDKKKIKIKILETIDDETEYFRFASVYSKEKGINQGLIWVIPDFRPNNGLQFDSTCFKTCDENIIIMLNRVFENAVINKPKKTIKGICLNGQVALSDPTVPDGEAKVLVTFLDEENKDTSYN